MRRIFILLPLFAVTLIALVYAFGSPKVEKVENIACTLEAKICPDGTAVGRVPPKCEFQVCPEVKDISVKNPAADQLISSPLKIEGIATGGWFFEAQFNAEMYDSEGKVIGSAILTAKGEWMTSDPVPFEGDITFSKPETQEGILKFLSSNPSGIPENQKEHSIPVRFAEVGEQSVLLYYYNQNNDLDETGNVMCSEKGLVAVTRELPATKTPIKDSISMFLKGIENLKPEDRAAGIGTEFPLEGVELKEVNLKSDGTLVVVLDDPKFTTSGGSCRVGILSMQLTKTIEQFPEVKRVQYSPESIFQP